MPADVQKIIILGGGTAGWMTAAALSRFLPDTYQITLVESDKIGTVGVGEATIPHIRYFNNMLGIDEREFLHAVGATYKLGIKFTDWGKVGTSYIHPFGSHGYTLNGIDFHHYWLAINRSGIDIAFDQFSLAVVMAQNNKFAFPEPNDGDVKNSFTYAYHIDAGAYAKFLREYSQTRGVNRVEGILKGVDTDSSTGEIKCLYLESGLVLSADFFIDCSGFNALLLSGCLGEGFDDWSHWLPCDRAVAIPTASSTTSIISPYTEATAHAWGWQWRIPLQHRVGNGMVYASSAISDDNAATKLLSAIPGQPLAEPNFLRFKAGRRKKSWIKNCVAIGLASGFLEPLESTSIYLIQQGILKLLEYFPLGKNERSLCDAYNNDMETEYLRIRDFLILHYVITQRTDSEFWQYCKNMSIPDSLAQKIELFSATGHIARYQYGLFMSPSWLAVYFGQGLVGGNYDLRVLSYPRENILAQFKKIRVQLDYSVAQMQLSQDVLANECQQLEKCHRLAANSLYGVL